MPVFLPAPDENLWVGVLRLGIVVPGSRSLKDKRRAVSQIRDRLRARQNVSVAEVGHLDSPLRAVMAIAMVANDPRFLRSALDGLAHEIQGWSAALVEDVTVTIQRPDELSFEDERDG